MPVLEMASVNSWFHLPNILFSSLQLKLFDIELRRAIQDAKLKKLLNIFCIVYFRETKLYVALQKLTEKIFA